MKIRCIGAYGPQEKDSIEKKNNFWARLSKEVEEAQEEDLGMIFQMDGNLWAGNEIVKGDPNLCNGNGKLFKEFLLKHPYVTVVNSMDCCKGLITRRRKTKTKLEESVLDFFGVNDKIHQFVESMTIDEDKKFGLTRFSKNGNTDSDHHTEILDLNIQFNKKKEERMELFNFKNQECQEVFHQLTETKSELLDCFQNDNEFKNQTTQWFKKLNGYFYQSFKKIRCSNFKKESELDLLLKERAELIQKLKKVEEEEMEDVKITIRKI